MMVSDTVCTIIVKGRRGKQWRIPLARKDDPVRALDKLCRSGKISLTDISGVFCEPYDPNAITTRAAEASAEILSLIVRRFS
jgi:hypothetical protein